MISKQEREELISIIHSLPDEKLPEIKDYLLFLQSRYGKPPIIDESESWSEEDLRDISTASLNYANELYGDE